MRKALSIAIVLSIAVVTASAVQADPTTVQRIIAQERGRHADSRLFEPAGFAPVQVVGRPGGFDWRDAGIGSAAALALALLATAGVALLRDSRRQHVSGEGRS